jgi:hypothetical protein
MTDLGIRLRRFSFLELRGDFPYKLFGSFRINVTYFSPLLVYGRARRGG